MRFWFLIFIACLSGFGFSHVLVLRNGQKLVIPDGYKIDGDWVIFSNEQGDILQFPLSRVDLEKTEELNKQQQQKSKLKAEIKDPVVPKAGKLEKEKGISLDNKSLESFKKEKKGEHVPKFDTLDASLEEGGTSLGNTPSYHRSRQTDGAQIRDRQASLNERYTNRQKGMKKRLQRKKDSLKEERRLSREQPSSLSSMEYRNARIKKIKEEISALEKEMMELKNEARQKGARPRDP